MMPDETLSADSEVRVGTSEGVLIGCRDSEADVFLGIPYAAPPVGSLRFRSPRAPRAWNGERAALKRGHPAVQSNPDFPAWLDPRPDSEDCLVINVWAPRTDRPLPVMVWIHGGAFVYGSSGAPVYDGRRLATTGDVVVVSLNHRLNAFGYLWLGDLAPEYAGEANLGQQDIVAALRWVQTNIGAFGGDPGNVTLFGESGGGAKISALGASPAASGLFHKAVLQSGSQTRLAERAEATEVARKYLDALGFGPDRVELLMRSTVSDLRAATDRIVASNGVLAFQPVVDGSVIRSQTWSSGQPAGLRDIPLIVGMTSDESVIFVPESLRYDFPDDDALVAGLREFWGGAAGIAPDRCRLLIDDYRRMMPAGSTRNELFVELASDIWMRRSQAIVLARRLDDNRAPTFVYEFADTTPCFGAHWATHASDLPMVFGNLDYPTAWDGQDSPEARTADDPDGARAQLSAEMIEAWSAFAHRGSPATLSLPWPPIAPGAVATMRFKRGLTDVVDNWRADRLRALDSLPAGW